MTEIEVQKRLQDKEDFPSLSEVAEEIVQLAQELSVPVHEVAAMLRTDSSLLQKMLAVLNGPFYRFIRPATNLDQAISFLGYKKVCSLAVGLSILGRFPTTWESDFSYREFWERGLCTAVASCEITGQLTDADLVEEPFTLGLIQDIGYLVLSRYYPYELGQTVGIAKAKDLHRVLAEQEFWNFDHTVIGEILCQHWRLPPLLTKFVRHHHFSDLGASAPEEDAATFKVANLANLVTEVFHGSDPAKNKEILKDRATDFFNFDEEDVTAILNKVPAHVKLIARTLSIELEKDAEHRDLDEGSYYERCTECGVQATGGGKFCSDCGASLEIILGPPRLNANKILVAEDSAATRLALVAIVKKMGCEAIEAINGSEAVRMARKEHPGVIIMDINMPILNGLDALRKIRSQKSTSHIPVIMLTSITDNQTVVDTLQSGANDYVVKPFTASLIQERVRKCMPEEEDTPKA